MRQRPLSELSALRAKGLLFRVAVNLSPRVLHDVDLPAQVESMLLAAYLKHLPVDETKIDQSFVLDLSRDASDAMIVRSTIELAHHLGLFVVAEGVEDAHALDLLGGWDCDAAQGFFMSRPLSSERLGEWLQSRAGVAHGTVSTMAARGRSLS